MKIFNLRIINTLFFLFLLLSSIIAKQPEWELIEKYSYQNHVESINWTNSSDFQSPRVENATISIKNDNNSQVISRKLVSGENRQVKIDLLAGSEVPFTLSSGHVKLIGPVGSPFYMWKPNETYYEIYDNFGEIHTTTEYKSENVRTHYIFGDGQYIGFDETTGILHIANPQINKYLELPLIESGLIGNYYFEGSQPHFCKSSGDVFIRFKYNHYYSMLISKDCEILINRDYDLGEIVFSSNGNYIAYFEDEVVDDQSLNSINIIDRDGSFVSQIVSEGKSFKFFDNYDELLVNTTDGFDTYNFKNGELIRSNPSMNFQAYSPNTQIIANIERVYYNSSKDHPDSSDPGLYLILRLYSINDIKEDDLFVESIWEHVLEPRIKNSSGMYPPTYVEISESGNEITCFVNQTVYIFKLKG